MLKRFAQDTMVLTASNVARFKIFSALLGNIFIGFAVKVGLRCSIANYAFGKFSRFYFKIFSALLENIFIGFAVKVGLRCSIANYAFGKFSRFYFKIFSALLENFLLKFPLFYDMLK